MTLPYIQLMLDKCQWDDESLRWGVDISMILDIYITSFSHMHVDVGLAKIDINNE